MADLIDVAIRFETVAVPVPEITVGETTLGLPSVPGLSLPAVTVPEVDVGETVVSLPETSLTVPVPSVTTDRIFLPPLPSFPYVESVFLDLDVDFATFDFLGFLEDVRLPVDVDLIGPDIEFGFFDAPDLPAIPVPEIDVDFQTRRVGGGVLQVPDVSVRPSLFDLPDLPSVDLPDVPIPTLAVDVGSVPIPDPTTLRAEVSVNTAGLRRELLGPLPKGLLQDPTAYVFTAVLAEIESRIGDGLVGTLKQLIDKLLAAVLDQDTQQRLKDQAE